MNSTRRSGLSVVVVVELDVDVLRLVVDVLDEVVVDVLVVVVEILVVLLRISWRKSTNSSSVGAGISLSFPYSLMLPPERKNGRSLDMRQRPSVLGWSIWF